MNFLGVLQRPLTLILLQKHRNTNARRIGIQIGGVYTTFCKKGIYFSKSIAIEMGGVSRYFSEALGSGVDLTLLTTTYFIQTVSHKNGMCVCQRRIGGVCAAEVSYCCGSISKAQVARTSLSVCIGHPQTCVYPDVCLGIAHVSGKAPLSGQGVW